MTNLVSISSVVAGDHPEGTTVTVTGVLNGMRARKTKQGNEWATFLLIDDKTAVDVNLFPAVYAEFRDLVGPVKDPNEHPFTNLRPPTLTLTGRVAAAGFLDHRPGLVVDGVVCGGHGAHGPHPPLPPIGQARIAVSYLTLAARSLRDAVAADAHTPVDELVRGVREALGEIWAVFADHDGNPLYERNEALFATNPDLAARLDDEAFTLGVELEPIAAKPVLAQTDGSGRARARSRRRLRGWLSDEGRPA